MTFTAAYFSPHVGSSFAPSLQDGQHGALTLESIKESTRDASPYTQFSLNFVSKDPNMLAQGTYELSHASLPTQAIFLVPVAKTEQGFRYVASFSVEK